MTPTAEEISVALGDVHEPHLRRSVNQLDMVRGIRVEGGRVLVRVALIVPGESAEEALRRAITERVRARFAVDDVRVAFEVMDDADRQAVMRGLREGVTQFGQGEASTQVVAVGSGKGGVGKSTTTSNLAASLARLGHSVGLLDADVWGFSIPRMLGVRAEPVVIGDAIVPPEAHGVKVVSIGLFTSEENPVVWRGPMLHKALQQFLTDVFWDEPDYLLVDLPPGTGDVSISIAQFLPGASMLIVTTPQPAAEKVAQRAGFMAEKTGLRVAGVVENMSFFRGDDGKRYRLFGEGGGRSLAQRLEVPLLGEIPMDPALRELADAGTPIVVGAPDSEVAQALELTAKEIANLLPPRPRRARRIALPLMQGRAGRGV
jgi:ATP-binding protein involved in chromosome partitioning